jgi:hypothetical protein
VGDHGVEISKLCGEGVDGEPGHGGWFVASEPVEHDGEDREGAAQPGGVDRGVVGADRQRDVVERGQRVAVYGLEAGQTGRQE